MKRATVIGAGLAGCEAALTLASLGVNVTLIEAKPTSMSPAHHSEGFAEVVCSNSFKSDEPYSASGLLKAELRLMKSKLMKVADAVRVPAGAALAVDRTKFSDQVTELVRSDPNIEIKSAVADSVELSDSVIIATGPLTLEPLASFLGELFGGNLYFYDAASPVIAAESVDGSRSFLAARYGKGDDYVNCPLTRDEYYAFVRELVSAERASLHDFDKVFEGCMPIEIMAARGADTLRFGPLKPVGLEGNERPFAVVQLRKEDENGSMLNMVGFQTNLKFGEQRRVFGMIPALAKAEFLRYGVMHKNTYIDAPKVIDRYLRIKAYPTCFVAGQLSGVEGYVESIATGLVAALNMYRTLCGEPMLELPPHTMVGALTWYLARMCGNFQPMNANLGLLPPLREQISDRTLRKEAVCKRATDCIKNLKIY